MHKNRRKWRIAGVVAIVIVIGVGFGIWMGVYDPDNTIMGNHVNATYFARSLGEDTYGSWEEAMRAKDENYTQEQLLYMSQTENVFKVFMQNGNEIAGYEFIAEDNCYQYIGERKLIFDGAVCPTEYDWETTVRSDLSYSTRHSYKKIIRLGTRYNVLPAWGVSEQERIREVTFDGQGMDEVIPFTSDGKTWYLWVIDDLKTQKDAREIQLQQPH